MGGSLFWEGLKGPLSYKGKAVNTESCVFFGGGRGAAPAAHGSCQAAVELD